MPGKEDFLGEDKQQPFMGMLVTGAGLAWLRGALWEGSGPEGKFKAIFTDFSVWWSPEAQSCFRSEKGTKLSVGNGHPFVTQPGVHEVGSREDAQRGCTSSSSPAANLMCNFGQCADSLARQPSAVLGLQRQRGRKRGSGFPELPNAVGQRDSWVPSHAPHQARP